MSLKLPSASPSPFSPYHPGGMPYEGRSVFLSAGTQGGVVPDVALTASEKARPEAMSDALSRLNQWVVSIAPGVSMLSGVGLLASSLGKLAETHVLSRVSRYGVSVSFFFGALNDVLSGVSSGQPTMVLAGLLQFIPSVLLAFAKKQRTQTYAYNLNMLLAGLWTVGFANEIANKNKMATREAKRDYDMTSFQQSLNPKTSWSAWQRVTTLGREGGKMLRFLVADHVNLIKALISKVTQAHPTAEKQEAFHWKALFEPSSTISRVSVLFTYLGAIPFLIWGLRSNSKAFEKTTGAFKTVALALANLSLLNLALHRKDWKGRSPLLGIPLTILGTPEAATKTQKAFSQLGEGLNSWFFSDVALNGLPKEKSLQIQA